MGLDVLRRIRRSAVRRRAIIGVPMIARVADKADFEELFSRGLRQLKSEQYAEAAGSFAQAAEVLPEDWHNRLLMTRSRQGAALMGAGRWTEALAVFDELADSRELPEFPRETFPDEIASIYWARAVCLEQLGRLSRARDVAVELIQEVGSGTTPTQRAYVAGLYLLQARAAEAEGRFRTAVGAAQAAIDQCRRYEEPQLNDLLHEAEEMHGSLTARIRFVEDES